MDAIPIKGSGIAIVKKKSIYENFPAIFSALIKSANTKNDSNNTGKNQAELGTVYENNV